MNKNLRIAGLPRNWQACNNDGEKIKTAIDKSSEITYNYEYREDGSVSGIEYGGEQTGKITTELDGKRRFFTNIFRFLGW